MLKLLPKIIRKSIRNKVFLSFIIVLLLVLIVYIFSYSNISDLGIASDKILELNYNSILAAVQMVDAIETIERNFNLYVNTNDIEKISEIDSNKHKFSQWIGRAQDNITESGEQKVLNKIDSLFISYIKQINLELNSSDFPDNENLRSSLRGELKTECYNLLSLNQDAMFQKSADAQKIARKGIASLSLIVLIVFFIGVLLSYGLSMRIVKPIYSLWDATQKITQGDYSTSLQTVSEDELGSLMIKFNEMTQQLQKFNDINLRTILSEQQKIQAIFSSIDDGILFISPEYIVLDANEQALKILNVTRDELKGHHFLENVHNDQLFKHLKHCVETQTAPVFTGKENLIITSHGNHKYYYQYFFTPLRDKRGLFFGSMFLIRDITDLKKIDQLKSEFVMIVSHELKTPLTSLSMSIDLIRESMLDKLRDSDKELLDIAKEDIMRLRLLVNDLLDLSKIEAGKINLQFKPIKPEDVLRTIMNHFKNQASEQKIQFEYKIENEMPEIYADEEKLLLVFINLITNALRYVHSGGFIHLKSELNGQFVTFSVKDNGEGIPLAFQNRIFERFIQVKGHNNAKGTGLGLTICKEIVRAHGGTIWVESNTGKGSEFFFTIPVHIENSIKES